MSEWVGAWLAGERGEGEGKRRRGVRRRRGACENQILAVQAPSFPPPSHRKLRVIGWPG